MNVKFDIPEMLKPLAWLTGVWKGEGAGMYPTIDPFVFRDVIEFRMAESIDQVLIRYTEKATMLDEGIERVKHEEAGFFRLTGNSGIELQVVQNTGRIEIFQGVFTQLDHGKEMFRLELDSMFVHNPAGSKTVRDSRRILEYADGVITYTQAMRTEELADLTHHLQIVLHR